MSANAAGADSGRPVSTVIQAHSSAIPTETGNGWGDTMPSGPSVTTQRPQGPLPSSGTSHVVAAPQFNTIQADPSAIPQMASPKPPPPAEATPPEPPKQPEPHRPTTGVQLDPQTRAALQKEAALLAKEQALRDSERELERLRVLENEWRTDPIAAAEKFGATPERWIDRFANSGDPAQSKGNNELEQVRQEIQALKAEREKERQSFEQRAQQQKYMEIRNGYMSRIGETISGNPEFSALKVAELAPAVYNLIESHAAHTQRTYGVADELGIEEACRQVAASVVPKMQQQIVALAEIPEFHAALRQAYSRIGGAPAGYQGNPPTGHHAPSSLPPVGPTQGAPQREMSRDESLAYAASLLRFDDEDNF